MSKLILLVGNIGSGKSTYAKRLVKEKNCFSVSRDAIRYMLNAGDYIFDREKESIVHNLTVRCLASLLAEGVDIVLDETNMNRKIRKHYIEFASEYDYECEAHVMPIISKEESVRRRMGDNHGTYSKEKWEEIWEMFDSRYVEPTEDEGLERIIKL